MQILWVILWGSSETNEMPPQKKFQIKIWYILTGSSDYSKTHLWTDTSWLHGLQNKSSDLVYILDENHFSCPLHLVLRCPAVTDQSLERGRITAGLLFTNLLLICLKLSEVIGEKRIMLWCSRHPPFKNCQHLVTLFHLFPLLHFFGWSVLKQTHGILLFHPWNL